jgi:pyruvate,orthophosphate dikinase
MFFGDERIPIVREMIMAVDAPGPAQGGGSLLPFQREDFVGIFTAMAALPVTIRLLDPPLHEFLPSTTRSRGVHRLDARGINPSVTPELGALKARLEALPRPTRCSGTAAAASASRSPRSTTCRCARSWRPPVGGREGVEVEPEIMIPLTGTVAEMKLTREMTPVARARCWETAATVRYSVGHDDRGAARGARRGPIAEHAEFFSFGTNDLTQMTYGYSRDDIGQVPAVYLEKKLCPRPVRGARPGGRGRAGAHRHRAGRRDRAGPEGRHLRRARRRALVGGVLPPGRDDLRLLLALHGPGAWLPRPAEVKEPRDGARGGRIEGITA